MYVYLFFAECDFYKAFHQVKGTNGVIFRNNQLLCSSLLPSPPCACLKAVLGNDLETLTGTEYEFICINGDMNKEVRLDLESKKLVVTGRGITTRYEYKDSLQLDMHI